MYTTLSSAICVLIEADWLSGFQCPAASTYYKNGSAHCDEEERKGLGRDHHHHGVWQWRGVWQQQEAPQSRELLGKRHEEEDKRRAGRAAAVDHEEKGSQAAASCQVFPVWDFIMQLSLPLQWRQCSLDWIKLPTSVKKTRKMSPGIFATMFV